MTNCDGCGKGMPTDDASVLCDDCYRIVTNFLTCLIKDDISPERRKIMNKCICRIDGYKKTVTDAIVEFCEEMFEDEREVDTLSITGNAFSSNGLSFSLKDGRNAYKLVYRNSTKVFEFFK